MINFLKGLIIGVGKIMPGVSGSVLAILLGVYEKSISYISNFKKNKKESIRYLLPLGGGIGISIILFSKIINILLIKCYFVTMMLFCGLIIGSFSSIGKKIIKKDYYIVLISFLILFLLSITNINNNYVMKNNYVDMFKFFLSGIIEGIGTILPGLSSSALLMINGTYNIIINSISSITNFKVLIPFFMGILFSIIILIKVINYLLLKHESKTYAFIYGTLISSIVLIIIKSLSVKYTVIDLIFGIILFVMGIMVTRLIKK